MVDIQKQVNKVLSYKDPEIRKREKLALEFFKKILKENEYPKWTIFDEDDVESICIDMEEEPSLEERIKKEYSIIVTYKDLWMPFWQFLDYLEEEQERQKNQKLLPKPEQVKA